MGLVLAVFGVGLGNMVANDLGQDVTWGRTQRGRCGKNTAEVRFTKDMGTFQHILKLPHVPWPGIGLQLLDLALAKEFSAMEAFMAFSNGNNVLRPVTAERARESAQC
jgi:hypothetical protein